MTPESDQMRVRRALRYARPFDGPRGTDFLFGLLGAFRRSGHPVSPDDIERWALDEGWSARDAAVIRGIALTAITACPT